LVASHAVTCSAVGFQFGNRQFNATNLGDALTLGLGYGANFIEVWTEDADDAMTHSDMAATLDAAAATILCFTWLELVYPNRTDPSILATIPRPLCWLFCPDISKRCALPS
jgi:hypothetical protein